MPTLRSAVRVAEELGVGLGLAGRGLPLLLGLGLDPGLVGLGLGSERLELLGAASCWAWTTRNTAGTR